MGIIKRIVAEVQAREIVGGELDMEYILGKTSIEEKLLDGLNDEKREIVSKLLKENRGN